MRRNCCRSDSQVSCLRGVRGVSCTSGHRHWPPAAHLQLKVGACEGSIVAAFAVHARVSGSAELVWFQASTPLLMTDARRLLQGASPGPLEQR